MHRAAATESAPAKTVVRNGSTTQPTVSLAPVVGQQQASRLQDTKELLAQTDTNLRQLAGRQLSANQQATVKQIRTYMDQAKHAEDSGDAQSAHNLASKAEQLSAEIITQ